MMATWYKANKNCPTPSTMEVAWLPPGKLDKNLSPLSFFGYLISTLSTLTRPNIDQKRLNRVLGILGHHSDFMNISE